MHSGLLVDFAVAFNLLINALKHDKDMKLNVNLWDFCVNMNFM